MDEATRLEELAKLIKQADCQDKSELLPTWKKLTDFDLKSLKVETIDCGFPSLNKFKLIKKNKGELIIIGGRPSMGKSAFMFQMASILSTSMPIFVISLEMTQQEIVQRLLSDNPYASVSTLEKEFKKYESLSYFIDDRGGLSVSQICETIRLIKEKENVKVVFIDHLSQIVEEAKAFSKDDAIGKITRALKQLAKELSLTIVLACQLNRGCETRGRLSNDYRPSLSDLRDSGNIEQDADIVLLVHREYRITKDINKKDLAEIIVAKNRNGPIGVSELKFNELKTQFIDEDLGI